MKSLKNISILLFFLFNLVNMTSAATCTLIATGNWSNPVNWSCGAVPGCGDVIVIPAGLTVNVDTQVDLDENSSPACSTATLISVSGTIQFITGFKISLACGSSVEIMVGGSMLPGGGGGMSNWLKICDFIEWKSSNGPVNGYKHYGSPLFLPVQFKSMQIIQMDNNFNINWTISSERENDFFEIEYSFDGEQWLELDRINSIGDHSEEYIYYSNYSINGLNNSIIYFRLSQTDLNGEKTILKTKAKSISNSKTILYPNPSNRTEGFDLLLTSDSQTKTDILIYNELGVIVQNLEVDLSMISSKFHINTDALKSGVYFIQINNNELNEILRLIIK